MSACCPVCERPATWRIAPGLDSCDRCLATALRLAYAAADAGFAPPVPTPLTPPVRVPARSHR